MDIISNIFGTNTDHLNSWQMMARAAFVFFASLVYIRIAGLRTLGKQTSFDQLTMLILGSILGRAVVTGSNFFGNMLGVLIIMLLHRILSWAAFKSHKIGCIVKGQPLVLLQDGKKQVDNLKKAYITSEDIEEALHLTLSTNEQQKIKAIYLERSGDISFIKDDTK